MQSDDEDLGQRVEAIWRTYDAEPPAEVVRFAGYVFARSAEGPWELTRREATPVS
jgi:hypothetical protein